MCHFWRISLHWLHVKLNPTISRDVDLPRETPRSSSYPFCTTDFALFRCVQDFLAAVVLSRSHCFQCCAWAWRLATGGVQPGSSSELGARLRLSALKRLCVYVCACEEGHPSDSFWSTLKVSWVWHGCLACTVTWNTGMAKIKLHIFPVITEFVCLISSMSKSILFVGI